MIATEHGVTITEAYDQIRRTAWTGGDQIAAVVETILNRHENDPEP